jgi:two-component system, LytTR family, response regulator
MMKCLLVDDNPVALLALKQILKQYPSIEIVNETENSFQALEILKQEAIDLIFLDVEMPGLSGLDLLKSYNQHPLIIIVSAKKDYAFESYEYTIVDYLLKPIDIARLTRAINKAQDLFDNSSNALEKADREYFYVKEKGSLHKILVNDIQYVHALGDYISIYLANRRYTIHMNLKEFEARIQSQLFMRIHRSYIVALDKIDRIEENTAIIESIPIPIGDAYRTALMNRIQLF